VHLTEAVAAVRTRHRDRIARVRGWALEYGRALSADLVALLIAAKEESSFFPPTELDHWTRPRVNHLLMVDVFDWCTRRSVLVPDGVPEALWSYLHYLDDAGELAPGSSPLAKLLDPLRCYGGLGPDGTQATWEPVVCRCYEE
jgi:hypothetical protein